MRSAVLFVVAACLLLTGCGYPGDPLPPALRRPMRVLDLSAVERGPKIAARFTMPKETTEGLDVPESAEIDIRVGPAPEGSFNTDIWEKTAQRIPPAQIHLEHGLVDAVADAAPYLNKTIVVAARVMGPKGRNAGWSNLVVLPIVNPLPRPLGVEAKDAPDAIRVEWHAASSRFRIYRRTDGKGEFVLTGTSEKPFFVDSTIEYSKSYEYRVQGFEAAGDKFAESEMSDVVSLKPTDRFAPSVPTGLTAVAGVRTIELTWDPNPEKDLAGYRVYRNGQRIGGDLATPAYSDADVQPGTTYSYQVTSFDTAGNESAKSPAATSALQ